jgi:hypothetical protein
MSKVIDKRAVAENRRRALLKIMADNGVNPTDLARKCGWGSPNVIYNFLRGDTSQLSATKYSDICKALPGITVADLMGERSAKTMPPVLVKTECRAGAFRESFSLPAKRIRELPLPVNDEARLAGAFAAEVRWPGAEQIYPDGSLLLCVPLDRADIKITKGRRLLVERFVDRKVEVTVREVQEDLQGNLWLSQRSTDPRYSDAIKLMSEISGRPWRQAGEIFALAGIVIGAFVPEG